jgi:hypothetical protein
MQIPKPDWEPSDKEKSLDEYASWVNSLARGTFLMDGKHPEMFFLVGEDGEIVGCQFRDYLPDEEKNSAILDMAKQLDVFGTIHARITTVYHPKVTGHPRSQDIDFLDGTSDELERICLIVEMESKNGTHKVWANPVLDTQGQPSLGDTLMADMA